MNKNRYRLISVVIAFAVIYLLIFLSGKTDLKVVSAGLVEECVVQAGVPSYTFLSDVDKNSSFNLVDSILNDIYPMNEYMLANENTGLAPEEQNNEPTKPENITGLGNNGEQPTANDGETGTAPAETASSQLQQNPSESNSNLDVISRNVVSGDVFARSDLNDYKFDLSKFYTVTSITSLTSDILRPEEFLNKDMKITHDASTPQILIFHTHSQEWFVDTEEGNPETTIVGVGNYLTKILTEKYGYNVIHDTTAYDMVDGHLDRSKAYTYSEEGAKKILEENPSIEVVIDLHRDGFDDPNLKFVTNIDGKDAAKVMLFNGLSYTKENGPIGYLYNPYRDDNLAMSLQMKLLGEAYYPGFLRNIYCNAYRYCLHMRPKSMLIEAGANTNTLQEEKNAMEPLADMLDKLLRGEKAYD